MWPIIIIAGIIFLIKATPTLTDIRNLQRQLQVQFGTGISIKQSGFNTIFQIPLTITNPSSGALTIKSISGTISRDGKELMQFSALKGITLTPRSKKNISLDAISPSISLAQSIFDVLRKGGVPKLDIKAFINTDFGVQEFSQQLFADLYHIRSSVKR